MKAMTVLLLLLWPAISVSAQPADEARVRELERKLEWATRQLEQLNETVLALRAELARIKGERVSADSQTASLAPQAETAKDEFARRVIEPELGASEREETLQARPEIFIQSRYSALPIRHTNGEFEPNFSMTRIETRWSGKVSERIGAGLEIQFHPALDGSPEELVNDAFVEYYLNDHATIRVGQFIRPFGFDIQQSSAVRESPERGMFAGYFFPGQRDRGVMLFGDLNFTSLKGVHYFIGAFNGNRFFADNNRQANYVMRIRKVFSTLAVGLSAQRGKQILPPGVTGDNDENLIGFDYQFKHRPSFNDDAVNGRFHINWSIEF
jgi:hypothetical protein